MSDEAQKETVPTEVGTFTGAISEPRIDQETRIRVIDADMEWAMNNCMSLLAKLALRQETRPDAHRALVETVHSACIIGWSRWVAAHANINHDEMEDMAAAVYRRLASVETASRAQMEKMSEGAVILRGKR